VKCFVQTIKSDHTSILHSLSAGKKVSISDCVVPLQIVVISVNAHPATLYQIFFHASPGNTILTALAKDNLAEGNQSCMAVSNVFVYPSTGGKVTVVTLGAERTPFQELSVLVIFVDGIYTSILFVSIVV